MSEGDATLYVLSAGHDDLYKIGRTTAPLARRIAQLNTGAARRLTLVASFRIARGTACKCESYVHARLEDLSVREGGGTEFFRCKPQEELCRRVREACEAFARFQSCIVDTLAESDAAKVADLFSLRLQLSAQTRELEIQKDMLEAALKLSFDDGFHRDGVPYLTWEKRSSNRFDVEAFKSDHPELYAEYSQLRSVRVPRFH